MEKNLNHIGYNKNKVAARIKKVSFRDESNSIYDSLPYFPLNRVPL